MSDGIFKNGELSEEDAKDLERQVSKIIDGDYIKKNEAISIPVLPKEHRKQFSSYDDAFETGWNEALSCVNLIPSADVVEVVHSDWSSIIGSMMVCPCCGLSVDVNITDAYFDHYTEVPNYCPNCGAKMDGEEQEHE